MKIDTHQKIFESIQTTQTNSEMYDDTIHAFLKRDIMLGICIGCIIAKTNIHVCVVGYYVPTWFRHPYEMLNRMFQHPGTVQCA